VVVLAVVLVAAAFLVGKAVLGRSGTGGDAVADPAAQTSTDPSVEPSPSESATGPAACGPETVSITLTADQRTYAAGAQPVFTVTITNTSNASCKIDAGEAKREVLVKSGTDRIWSSLDCLAADSPSRLLLLQAGARDETAVTWSRIRSAPGCAAVTATPKPGTYTAVATVAGVSSTAAVFDLK
jgi:hypothetical protein